MNENPSTSRALIDKVVDDNTYPTNPAAEAVLAEVLAALDVTDSSWAYGGAPSVTDYARAIVRALHRNYLDGIR